MHGFEVALTYLAAIGLLCLGLYLFAKVIQGHDRFQALYIDRKKKARAARAREDAMRNDGPVWSAIRSFFRFTFLLCSWLLVKAVILYVMLMVLMVAILLMKSTANDVRDWWHDKPRQ